MPRTQCCNVTLALWYVHVSDVFPSASLPSRYSCIAVFLFISYSVQAPVLFMPRYIYSCACILSLFSCISHKAWSPPDLFFSLTCIKSQISWPECSATLCRERYIHSSAYILSLILCISHEAWSPPDLFFSLTCIKSQTSWPEYSATLCRDECTAPRSGDASRYV